MDPFARVVRAGRVRLDGPPTLVAVLRRAGRAHLLHPVPLPLRPRDRPRGAHAGVDPAFFRAGFRRTVGADVVRRSPGTRRLRLRGSLRRG